jgi:hypothetical protein
MSIFYVSIKTSSSKKHLQRVVRLQRETLLHWFQVRLQRETLLLCLQIILQMETLVCRLQITEMGNTAPLASGETEVETLLQLLQVKLLLSRLKLHWQTLLH